MLIKIPKLPACFVVRAVACFSAWCPTQASSQRHAALSICDPNGKPVICHNFPAGRWFLQTLLYLYCIAIHPCHRFAHNVGPLLMYVACTQVHGVKTQQSASVCLPYLVATEQINTVLLVVMLCNLVEMCQCFRGTFWLHLQGRWKWQVPTQQSLFYWTVWCHIWEHSIVQGDQKISIHLMITIQRVTSNVQTSLVV
jgi:hypothetical protein